MAKGVKQIAMNLSGGVCPTIVCGVHKSGVHNTLPSEKPHQLYLAFLVIYAKDDSN